MAFKKGQSGNPKGKPKGATSKPRISDYMTEDEIIEIVQKAKTLALSGNELMIKLLIEQRFGKAAQSIDHTTGGKELPTPIMPLNVQGDNSNEESKETQKEN